MRASDVVLVAAIWIPLGVIGGPPAWKHWREPPPPPPVQASNGDRDFEITQAGVIFYTTNPNLVLDNVTCSLPAHCGIPMGK